MPEPLMLATWTFGRTANAAGWPYAFDSRDGGALDAVEQACRAVEADPAVATVGYGGRPDAAGEVTLDAAIMLSPARCGSVCFVRGFAHPISIARRVMDGSPHVLLAGDGAERFAREQGFSEQDLLTREGRQAYEQWRTASAAGAPPAAHANVEEETAGGADRGEDGHDTVGVLACDAGGTLAGACSSSGLPFKAPGRVGDSPVIGQGLYVDPSRGAAVATGHGELVMGVCGTFLAVERMGQGASPREAAAAVIRRIADRYDLAAQEQVAVIALTPDGRWAAAAIEPGFRTAIRTADRDDLVEPDWLLRA